MFALLPTSVCVPVMSYVAPSPSAKPSPPTVTSVCAFFVRAVPSYTFSPSADVSVTLRLLIVSVPSTFFTFVKFAVLSFSWASLITYPSLTTFALEPASVWLPLAVASTVKPSGRPLAVTFFSPVPSHVSAVPSYVLLSEGAVSVTSALFAVIVSLPSSSVIV